MAYIHQLATALPDAAYPQERVRDVVVDWLGGGRRAERLLARVYRHSGIDTRHSVIRDFLPGAPGGLFYDPDAGGYQRPGTGARNALYAQEARALFACAARRALTASGFEPTAVTHVVTASCTGFYAPGPGYHLIRELGLPEDAERYHIGFMGCFAAFPALKLARALCAADPDATVLVVCLELCTLHLDPSLDPDDIVATSVFADGAAAAVVRADPPAAGPGLELAGFATTLASEGEQAMAWTIGDTGFEMVLSSYVPAILGTRIGGAVDGLLARLGVDRDAIGRWAIHPGGRAILDRVEQALALDDDALAASRDVLRACGNMSSATILFVLERLLAMGGPSGERIYGAAFGPGLTVESGLFVRA